MMYELIQASAHSLPMIADGSIHAIVTSPPYFGLRRYDGDQDIEWPTVEYAPMPGLPAVRIQGCEPGCEHEWTDGPMVKSSPQRDASGGVGGGRPHGTRGEQPSNAGRAFETNQGRYCLHCGGWRGPLGLEPDPLAYVGHLILCLREWKRVLRDDGTAWVNLGSSYVSKTDDLYTLRDNLTPEERDYVLAELARCSA